jgi:hypothetical protein
MWMMICRADGRDPAGNGAFAAASLTTHAKRGVAGAAKDGKVKSYSDHEDSVYSAFPPSLASK